MLVVLGLHEAGATAKTGQALLSRLEGAGSSRGHGNGSRRLHHMELVLGKLVSELHRLKDTSSCDTEQSVVPDSTISPGNQLLDLRIVLQIPDLKAALIPKEQHLLLLQSCFVPKLQLGKLDKYYILLVRRVGGEMVITS